MILPLSSLLKPYAKQPHAAQFKMAFNTYHSRHLSILPSVPNLCAFKSFYMTFYIECLLSYFALLKSV